MYEGVINQVQDHCFAMRRQF